LRGEVVLNEMNVDRRHERVRWGIISTGRIAHQFAQDFRFVPNGELVAVASRSGFQAEAFAETYGIPRAYAGYELMLEDPEVDAVYVATPHTLHYGNSKDAIRAGKHVLCEKPFTVGAREARNLFRLSDQSSVFIMEGMWTYFLPAIRKAMQWIKQGRIGTVRQLKADFGYPQLPYDPESREYSVDLAGGCLFDMGIYPIAMAWLVMQRDPENIQVFSHHAPNGVDDDVVMVFDYGLKGGGTLATLACSFRSTLHNACHIIGEHGYIAIPDFWRAKECRLYQLDEPVDHFTDDRESIGLNFEAIAVNEDILSGLKQNVIMTWNNTIKFQEHMSRVKRLFDSCA
jgi:predicted dehydrogenase